MPRRRDDDDDRRDVHVYHHSSKEKKPGGLATCFGCAVLLLAGVGALVVAVGLIAFWPRGDQPRPGQPQPAQQRR